MRQLGLTAVAGLIGTVVGLVAGLDGQILFFYLPAVLAGGAGALSASLWPPSTLPSRRPVSTDKRQLAPIAAILQPIARAPVVAEATVGATSETARPLAIIKCPILI
jgi:hypothetical protein